MQTLPEHAAEHAAEYAEDAVAPTVRGSPQLIREGLPGRDWSALVPTSKPATPAMIHYLTAQKFDPSMRLWLKQLGNPEWFHDPLEVWKKAGYVLPKPALDKFFQTCVFDAVGRVGYADNLHDLLALPSAQPEFSALMPGTSDLYRWAPQEFSIDHLAALGLKGVTEAAWCALALWLSYHDNKQWPYLRDGGNPKKSYGTAGRLRTFARAVTADCRILDILEQAQATEQWIEFVRANLLAHIKRASAQMPLQGSNSGGHLEKSEFAETCQVGLAVYALNLARERLPATDGIQSTIDSMIGRFIAIIDVARIDDLTYHYDTAIDPTGQPYVSAEMLEKMVKKVDPATGNVLQTGAPHGIASVNWMLVPALEGQHYAALHMDAISPNSAWKDRPELIAATFGFID